MWKDIKGFNGKYQINEYGVVKRTEYISTTKKSNGSTYKRFFKEKILSEHIDSIGYYAVSLNNKKYRIHWLLYNTFIGDSRGFVIDHIDRNKLNNSLSNLRCVENSVNIKNAKHKYSPDIQDMSYRYKYPEKSHPFKLRFSIEGKRKVIGYYKTYDEALQKYNELYAKREKYYLEKYGCVN